MGISPAIAKRYIQHLRDVNAVPIHTLRFLRGEIIRWQPSLAEFFDEFPNLKTCLIKDWSSRWIESVPEECDEAIARHPGVHVIDKSVTWETVLEDPDNPQGPIRRYASGSPVMVRQVCSSRFCSDGNHFLGNTRVVTDD